MTYTPIGRIRMIHRGAHDPTAAYEALDVVRSADGFACYMALRDVPAGAVLEDGQNWGLMTGTGIKAVADAVCAPFAESGSIVQVRPVEGYPLAVKTAIEPVQAGSGDPSASNVRPISGRTSAQLTRCGVNLFKPSFVGAKSANGITITLNSIGAVTLNGTATGTTIFNIYDGPNFFAPSVDYSLSYTSKYAAAANAEMGVWCIDGSGAGHYVASTASAYQITFRVPADTVTVQIRVRLTAGATFANMLFPVYLNSGTEIVTGEYYQGDTSSVEFGRTVYGGVMDWATGALTVTHGLITAYAGENLPGKWISDRDVYAAGAVPTVGAQVAYELAEPDTVQLTPQQLPARSGVNTLYSDAGTTTVSGRSDMLWLVQSLADRVAALEE